jgi:DNA-binding response OmpR family regulator
MRKVLIIEDDNFLQGLEGSKLKTEGYQVIVASTGEEAMVKIHEEGIDLILLDLILPNFDGFEILKKIKEDDKLKDIPVIVFSNLSEDKDIDKARNMGVSDFMVKSNFTLDELVDHVNRKLKK